MRLSAAFSVLTAVGFAGLAGYLALNWLEQQRRPPETVIVEKKAAKKTIVVAADRLRYGSELSKKNLREVDWHAPQLPEGAFSRLSDLVGSAEKRYAISSLEPNEPVLKWKVTGPGQRPSLSALLSPGMKAVTIRVNDVNGIAGFVLPGDRVDIMLTRKASKSAYTEVLLQGVRVLGVDQIADERTDKKAVVAKSVTVEVRTEDAQRIVLASTIGNLSLALRSPETSEAEPAIRMTPASLVDEGVPGASSASQGQRMSRTVGVTRAVQRSEYAVPSLGDVADPPLPLLDRLRPKKNQGLPLTTASIPKRRSKPQTKKQSRPERGISIAGREPMRASAAMGQWMTLVQPSGPVTRAQ